MVRSTQHGGAAMFHETYDTPDRQYQAGQSACVLSTAGWMIYSLFVLGAITLDSGTALWIGMPFSFAMGFLNWFVFHRRFKNGWVISQVSMHWFKASIVTALIGVTMTVWALAVALLPNITVQQTLTGSAATFVTGHIVYTLVNLLMAQRPE